MLMNLVKKLRNSLLVVIIFMNLKIEKKSLKYVSRQLVLINLSDREKDYLEILDDDFEVINEIKNVKNSQMEDYTI